MNDFEEYLKNYLIKHIKELEEIINSMEERYPVNNLLLEREKGRIATYRGILRVLTQWFENYD